MTTSVKRKPPYVQEFRDHDGGLRLYFRRPGYARVPLPGPLHSPEFMKAYLAASAGGPVKAATTGARHARSLSALIESYYRSPGFKGIRASTRKTYRSTLEPLRQAHGHRLVKDMRKAHVMALISEKSDTPTAANNLLKRLRQIMKHAIALEWRADDPTVGVESYSVDSQGIHTWDEGEIARFMEVHPEGTTAHLAMTLMLYTGAARADAVALGWANVRDGRISYRRQKTNRQKQDVVIDITIHPELARVLAGCAKTNFTFLHTANGKSRSSDGLGTSMRKWCDAAGLPECSSHGLRKAIARRLADAGATTNEIAAVTGHRTLAEVQRYTDAANRSNSWPKRHGQIAGIRPGTESVKPPQKV